MRQTASAAYACRIAGRPLIVAMIVMLLTLPAAAQDTVYIASGSSTQGYTKLTGQVLDYTGSELRLALPGGAEQSYPAEKVLRIETRYSRQQMDAEGLFSQGEFASALALYGAARSSEPRPWVRRGITAQMVWCYRALGQQAQAGEEFLVLIRSDPKTVHFACIPLAWVASQPSLLLEQTARQWLARDEMPAAVLLGASHLMSTASRPAVVARLKKLTSDSDPRVAALALAQTWRAAVVTADQRQLQTWRDAIQRMPESLRPGPYYVFALACAQQQDWEQAALALLRIPILYPEHRLLAARSLLDAGSSLEKLQRTKQAARLYHELIDTYPQSRSAAEAHSRLEQMAKDRG